MSIEKKLKKQLEQRPSDVYVFSTGCTLIPYKLSNGKWGWVVSNFEDGTFFDGEEVMTIENWSENITDLVDDPDYIDEDEDDEESWEKEQEEIEEQKRLKDEDDERSWNGVK